MKLQKRWDLLWETGFVKRDRVLGNGLWMVGLTLLLVLVSILIVYYRVPSVIPFFYTKPWGEAQLVPKQGLAIYGLGLLLGTLGMIGLAVGLYKLDKFLSKVLVWCLAMILFLALLSVFTIWWRVGY